MFTRPVKQKIIASNTYSQNQNKMLYITKKNQANLTMLRQNKLKQPTNYFVTSQNLFEVETIWRC